MHHKFLRGNLHGLSQMVEHVPVRLVKHEQINSLLRYTGTRYQLLHGSRNRAQCEGKDLAPVHVQVVRRSNVAAVVHRGNGALGRTRAPQSSGPHNQIPCAPAVGAEQKRANQGLGMVLKGGYQRSRRGVAEKRAHALVFRMYKFTVGFRSEEQYVDRLPRLDKATSQAEAIDKTGTAKVEVKRASRGRNAETLLHQTGRCRQEIVRALGAEKDKIDLRRRAYPRIEQLPSGRYRQIGGALLRARNMSQRDAGFLLNPLYRPFWE